jgi:hypothetical protein
MAGQLDVSIAEASSPLLFPPIATVLPGTSLVPVAMVRPLAELDVDLVVYSSKDTLGYTGPIVSRPASDDRVKGSYESHLGATSVLSNDISYLV